MSALDRTDRQPRVVQRRPSVGDQGQRFVVERSFESAPTAMDRMAAVGRRPFGEPGRPVADTQTFAREWSLGRTRRDQGAHVFVRQWRWLARSDVGCSNRPAGGPNALLVLQQGVEEAGPCQPRASIVGWCRCGQSSRSAVAIFKGLTIPQSLLLRADR